MNISLFKNATSTDPEDIDLTETIAQIKFGRWKDVISSIRTLTGEAYDKAKRDLPAVTWSGNFKKRKASEIINYSQYIIIDVDKLTDEQINNLKGQLLHDEYCCFAFTSPSGKGLKALFKVNTEVEHHLSAFLHLQNYFENKYLVKVDDSGKDLCRLCFVSYDENCVNKTAKVFEVNTAYGVVNSYTPPARLANYKPTTDISKIFEICKGWITNYSYVKGQRNNYIHSLSCALNRCGVSAQDTENLLLSNFGDMDIKEVQHVVKSSYFHYSSEHGSVEIKDIGGVKNFKAPPAIPNFTEDVVQNDLMRITANLHHYKLPKADLLDIVGKIAKYYKKEGLIDLDRKGLLGLMNEAIKILKTKVVEATDGLTLKYTVAGDIGKDFIDTDVNESCVPTTFPEIDAALRGGLMPGNFYGLIGVGGTYKSIIAQYISVAAAHQNKAVLYLSGEMSSYQIYERLVSMVLHLNFYVEKSQGRIHKGNMEDIISEINIATNNSLFFVNKPGFGKDEILATIQNIEASSGKKIKLVIIDGVSNMDEMGMQEIPAAIFNTKMCKEIAKQANDEEGVAVVGLMHISGSQDTAKIRRDNGPFCRGGGKTISNMDGYFNTSLLVDPATNDFDNNGDILFLENKFYLRYIDKRSGAGTVSCIVNVDKNINLEVENTDPKNYEVKIEFKK